MKWLYLYIIDGFPSIAISYRPLDALHVRKRVYYKLTGSTIIRLISSADKYTDKTDYGTGIQVITFEMKRSSK